MWLLRKAMSQVDLVEAELVPETLAGDLLDRSGNSVTNMLDRFRADEVSLERDIADLTERLRQTRIAITAFESAGAIIDGGKLSSAEAAPPKKIGRLVPRAVPAADTIVHVHKDIRA